MESSFKSEAHAHIPTFLVLDSTRLLESSALEPGSRAFLLGSFIAHEIAITVDETGPAPSGSVSCGVQAWVSIFRTCELGRRL